MKGPTPGCAQRLAACAFGCVLATATHAQDRVTLAELEGVVIEIKVVRQQVLHAKGKTYPNRFHLGVIVTVGGDEDLSVRADVVNHTPTGEHKSKPETIAVKLQKPGAAQMFGSGTGMWLFNEGKLTYLRTFQNGAYKRDVTIKRTAQQLTCEVKEGFAREEGKPNIMWNSSHDGSLIKLVSDELVSATCAIRKP